MTPDDLLKLGNAPLLAIIAYFQFRIHTDNKVFLARMETTIQTLIEFVRASDQKRDG